MQWFPQMLGLLGFRNGFSISFSGSRPQMLGFRKGFSISSYKLKSKIESSDSSRTVIRSSSSGRLIGKAFNAPLMSSSSVRYGKVHLGRSFPLTCCRLQCSWRPTFCYLYERACQVKLLIHPGGRPARLDSASSTQTVARAMNDQATRVIIL